MTIVRALSRKIIFAAARTLDRIADLVHGAQVEDENILLLEQLVAELTYHLQKQTNLTH